MGLVQYCQYFPDNQNIFLELAPPHELAVPFYAPSPYKLLSIVGPLALKSHISLRVITSGGTRAPASVRDFL